MTKRAPMIFDWLLSLFSQDERYRLKVGRALRATYRLPMPDMGGRPLSVSKGELEGILMQTTLWAWWCHRRGMAPSSRELAERVKDRLFELSDYNRWLRSPER